MKIHYQLIAFIVITFLFGCNLKKTHKSDKADSLAVKTTDNTDWDNEFQGSFIYHFMTDQTFQRERTSEDIKGLDYVNYFAAMDYTLHIFPSFKSKDDKNLISDVDKQNLLSVLENEEFKTFSFSKDNNKWYLKSLVKSPFNPDSAIGFIDFLYDFSKDTSFRNSHIKFPLKFTYLDMEDLKDTTEYLTIQDLSDFNFDIFRDKYFCFFHSGLDKIDNADRICLLFRGIDNGIFLLYYFERKDDVWQLVREEDYST